MYCTADTIEYCTLVVNAAAGWEALCIAAARARAFRLSSDLPRQPTDFRRQVPLQLGSYRSAEQPVPRAAAMMNHVQHGFSSKNLCIRPREPRGQKVYEDNTYTAEEVCAFFT